MANSPLQNAPASAGLVKPLSVPDSPVFDTDAIIEAMRNESFIGTDRRPDTDKIATGTIYHFFEGRKQDSNGHWQGTGYFYWQKVYKDPATGKRIKKGGKAFASCPDDERKRQYLKDTGRIIELDTGRLQKVQRNTDTLFARASASVYEIQP